MKLIGAYNANVQPKSTIRDIKQDCCSHDMRQASTLRLALPLFSFGHAAREDGGGRDPMITKKPSGWMD